MIRPIKELSMTMCIHEHSGRDLVKAYHRSISILTGERD